jgi:hypothetical protein
MGSTAEVGSGAHMDPAVVMAEASLALKEPETVEQALARLVGVVLSVFPGAEQCDITIADRTGVTML